MSRQDAELPPVPDDIREAGRLAPGPWPGVVDPMWSGAGKPPARAMTGRWRSGPDGEIVEWADDLDHRPSPRALPAAPAGCEPAVPTVPGGGPLSAAALDGTPAVAVRDGSGERSHTAAARAASRVLTEAVQPVRGTDA